MIIVMPDAKTRYFGSLYSSSVTIGDWESFIARDLVSYIDSHYRTLASRDSRGLAGHSMGGYGTIRIGMKHPEVFSSIYALSACCLAPPPDLITPALPDPSRAKAQEIRTDDEAAAADFWTKATLASAAAWSPDPANTPRFFDLPWQDGRFQPLVADKWAANAPLVTLDQYVPNLRRLKAIAIDIGTQDSLLPGVHDLDAALTRYGIAHTYETYDGDHLNRIAARFEKNVLPFFAHNLRFEGH
jgi:S-formylglutathione hydrolase FrmB